MTETIPDILARIIARKREELARKIGRLEVWERLAESRRPGRRDFRAALGERVPAIVAEVKKASPSRGLLCAFFDPGAIAADYQRGGASAISVLTDESFFQGSLDDLEQVRTAVDLPVLRKDFTIAEADVTEAAGHGADAILLIAAILNQRELRDFRESAGRYGMAALVEVHNRRELDIAIASGAEIIGVNNRDLTTFQVTLETSLELAEHMPAGVLKVSESGIHDAADVARLRAAGFSVFLVGEHLMKSGDPAAALGPFGGGMILKICGITNQEDATAAIEAGATAVGFNFYPRSPRYLPPERVAAIETSEGVRRVGVFVNETRERVEEIASMARLDTAQLHGDEKPEDYPRKLSMAQEFLNVWKAIRIDGHFDFALYADLPLEALLLDGPAAELYGGAGKAFDWRLAQKANRKTVLAGGLDASNVAAAIELVRPWGVDACSRIESTPGKKDHKKMIEFLQAAMLAAL